MASIINRSGHLYVNYYENKKRRTVALKLLDNKSARNVAKKVCVEVDYLLSRNIKVDVHLIKRSLFNKVEYPVNNIIIPPKEEIVTLSEGWNRFESVHRKGLKSNYYRAIKTLIDLIGDIDIKQVDEVTSADFKELLESKDFKDTTVCNYFVQLSTIWNFFLKKKLADEKPWQKTSIKSKEVVIIPEDEIKLILDHLNTFESHLDYFLIKFLYMTGARISEALRFTKTDINFKLNKFNLDNRKRNREDAIPIYAALEPLLHQMVDEITTDPFFKFYTPQTSHLMFKKACRTLKIREYKLHHLRSTFITKMSGFCKSIDELKMWARHRNISTTLKYYVHTDKVKAAEQVIW